MSELEKRAMLVSINVTLGGLLGERRDKGANEVVSKAYGSNAKRTKAAKYLIDRTNKQVKAVVAAAQRVRDTTYYYSFPWGDTKLRLVPVKAHDKFRAAIDKDLKHLEQAEADYIAVYPQLVDQSRQAIVGLGGLFDGSQYPTQDTLKAMFRHGIEYWPIPQAGNFVADLAQDAADEARKALIEANEQRAKSAVNELIARVEKGVSSYVEKLASYRNTDLGVVGIFRDSLISNIEEIAELIRTLNFNDSPDIDILANNVQRLGRFTADALRDSDSLRQQMVSEGQSLIARLDSYRNVDSEVSNIIDQVGDYMRFV